MTRETSIAVYRELEASGMLSKLRLIVAGDIARHGPTTSGETCRRLLGDRRPKYIDSYHQRFADLEKMGVIQVVGERICHIAGKTCVEWDLTGRMPVKLKKSLTRVEQERARIITLIRDWIEGDDQRDLRDVLSAIEAE